MHFKLNFEKMKVIFRGLLSQVIVVLFFLVFTNVRNFHCRISGVDAYLYINIIP